MTRTTPQCPITRIRGAASPTAWTRQGGRAPGPGGIPGIGCLPQMRRDVLGLMLEGHRKYGDVVRFKVGPLTVHLICHPDDIAHVFARPDRYDKNTLASARIRDLTGPGLLVTNGDQWAAQRQAIQPAFKASRVMGFVAPIVERTRRMLDRWDHAARSGEPIDVASEMMRLTYSIIEGTLFSTDHEESMGEIEHAITIALGHTYRRIQNPLSPPAWLPTPGNRRFARALQTLEQRVDRIIAEHRQGDRHHDLLTDLIGRGGSGGCPHMSDQALRSQTITLLLAGHETTANALTWFWHLLDQHPAVGDRVHEEACRVLGTNPPGQDRMDALTYTSMALREAMRLHTPIWAIFRRVTDDDMIRDYRIRRGTRVIISPYVTHRHADFWSDAERFDPTRFEPCQARAQHPWAYIPFGGGPRFCVGQNLARLEALIIAAMVAQRYRLRRVPDHPVEQEPGITLRCRHGLKMIVERRESTS